MILKRIKFIMLVHSQTDQTLYAETGEKSNGQFPICFKQR